ncbi:hypothetical protein V3H18_01065 [Methylocystis sp. 9N]|uniref:Uncharacterized protein n=1 Tax=Methylocystis borbori TaxID=3118750 RepID=A0ABU7XCK1_9HYPH
MTQSGLTEPSRSAELAERLRKAYLRAIVDAIEVDDRVIRIYGSKASLERPLSPENRKGVRGGLIVRGFIGKWRAGQDKDANIYCIGIAI